MVALHSRPAPSKTLLLACTALLVLSAMPLVPAANAVLVLCPVDEVIRIFISHTGPTATGSASPGGLADVVVASISREAVRLTSPQQQGAAVPSEGVHAGASPAYPSSSDCEGGGGGEPGDPLTAPCTYPDSIEGVVITYLGIVNALCVEDPPGIALCVREDVNAGVVDNRLCADEPPGGSIACVSDYVNGALLADRTCVDYTDTGGNCVSHYVQGAAQYSDRTCADPGDNGQACVSNYSGDGTLNARLCPGDQDEQGHACPTFYDHGRRVERACADTDANGDPCYSSYTQDASTNARACTDRDDREQPCYSAYTSANTHGRLCTDQDDSGFPCYSVYTQNPTEQARVCQDNDGRSDQPCYTAYANGVREDHACHEPDGADQCASDTIWNGDRLTGCLDQSDDGQAGHACGKLLLDGGELERACNDPEPGLILCGSDYVLATAASDRTCVGTYPEGLCASNAATASNALVEDRVCKTADEFGNPCVSNIVYLGGAPLVEDRTCPATSYDGEAPCASHLVAAPTLQHSVEVRTCSHNNPETQQPCVRATVLVDGSAQQPQDRCVPTAVLCPSPQVGVVVDGDGSHCADDPCPGPADTTNVAACGQGPFCPGNVVLVPQPDETLAVVCGQAVDHPCEQSVDTTNVGACGSPALCPGGVALVPQPADDLATACGNAVPNPCKSVDPSNVAACGYGPFCVGGASSVDTTNVAACGRPAACPGGAYLVQQPDDTLAVVCGTPVDHPCEQSVDTTNVGACGSPALCPGNVVLVPQPDETLAVVCGKPIDHPCEQSVDTWHVAACGAVGPVCEDGAYALDGNGRPTRACNEAIPGACPEPVAFPPGHLLAVCGVPVDAPCPESVDAWHVAACGLVEPVCPDGAYALDGNGVPTEACGEPVPKPCPEGVDPWHVAACGTDPVCPDGAYELDGDNWPMTVCGEPWPCQEVVGPVALGQPIVVCGQPLPNLVPPGVVPDCMDGLDNDGDGRADFRPVGVGGGDPGCFTPLDDDEAA